MRMKKHIGMKGLAAISLAIGAVLAASAAPAKSARGSLAGHGANARAAFQDMQRLGYSGSAAVSKNGKLIMAAAAGEADAGRPYRTDTKSDIASLTKPITAMGIFKLMHQGKLSIDDRVGKWFPQAPTETRQVTIRQILNHSGGIADRPPGVGDYFRLSADEMAAKTLAQPLEFKPGTRTSYSNGGFNLLAIIIEKASGKQINQFMKDEIFAPAKVSGSYDPEDFAAEEIANGPTPSSKWGNVRALAAARKGPFFGLWGAGGIYMSSTDLVRLFDAYWSGKIIPKALVRQAITPPLREPNHAQEALGWTIIRTSRDDDFISYTGGSYHSGASIRYYPKNRVTIAAVGNSRSPGAVRVSRHLASALVGEDFEPLQPAEKLPALETSNAADVAFVRSLFTAAASGREARLQFIAKHFSAKAREAGVDRLAAMMGDFGRNGIPPIHSVSREGDRISAVTEQLEGERPMLLRLDIQLSGPADQPQIDGIRAEPLQLRQAPK
jgi:CubicO group peptidase (beta-lactamase class C family)